MDDPFQLLANPIIWLILLVQAGLVVLVLVRVPLSIRQFAALWEQIRQLRRRDRVLRHEQTALRTQLAAIQTTLAAVAKSDEVAAMQKQLLEGLAPLLAGLMKEQINGHGRPKRALWNSMVPENGPVDAGTVDQLLHARLLAAYPTPSALAQMVNFRLGENLAVVAGGESLGEQAFNLIVWARSENRVAELELAVQERR